jgi:uncharacterized protein involved in exopolysaccharide biosynthesis
MPEATGPSLRDFLHVIFKRKTQVLLFFAATVCTVAIATFLIRPTYEVTSQILVKMGRENLYVPASAKLSPVINFNREAQMKSEIEILRSRSLAETVAENLGPTVIYKDLKDESQGIFRRFFSSSQSPQTLVEKAGLQLQKDVKLEEIEKSNVIKISFKHKDPQTAATVVDTLVKLYLDRHLRIHKDSQSYEFFKEQSEHLKDKLRQSQERLEAFKKQHNVSSLNEERSLLLKQVADLRVALNQTLSQEAETKNRIRQLDKQLATTSKTIPQVAEMDHNPQLISTLEARLIELEIKENELTTKYTDQSRLVRNVREEIKMVQEKLAQQETKRYERSSYGVNTTYQRLQEDFFRNEAELRALKGKKEAQTAQLAEYQSRLKELNGRELELNQIQNQLEVDQQNFQLYQTKFEESRISDAMDKEKIVNVSLIEPVRPPLKPVSPKILLNMAIAVLLGGFGGFGLAFLLEYLDDSLEKAEDVEDYLQLPVLSSIPELKF